MEIRPLKADDDRERFSSGEPDLDRFLQRYAGQNQFRHHIGATYVAVEEDRIVGFATVVAGGIQVESLAPHQRKKLPRYPLPVLRLARLAVDRTAQGRGVGKQLLLFVFGLARRMASDFGCIGILADAKPNAVGFYESSGFESIEILEGGSGARPVPTPMFLALSEIESAAGGEG